MLTAVLDRRGGLVFERFHLSRPRYSAIVATSAILAIIWKPGFKAIKRVRYTTVMSIQFNHVIMFFFLQIAVFLFLFPIVVVVASFV